MAKRVLGCLMALSLLVGTAALVGCGDPPPSQGLSDAEKEKIKADKAKRDAETMKAAEEAKKKAESGG